VEWAPTESGEHREEGEPLIELACKHCGFIRMHLPGWHRGE
jgi:hypothetical protein